MIKEGTILFTGIILEPDIKRQVCYFLAFYRSSSKHKEQRAGKSQAIEDAFTHDTKITAGLEHL